MLKRYAVRIFDGTFTRVYNTQAFSAEEAQERAEIQHVVGTKGRIERVTVTEIGR